MADGFKFTGKGSWFGGPRDSMDSGKMAGGNTTALPAVAVRLPGKSWRDSRKYLNKYVRVTAPNGRSAVYRVGDLGPNESTGRNVDITYSGLKRLGYTEGNFPTDAKFKVEYIGDKPDQPVAGRGLKAVKGVKAKTTETFDADGYDAARRKAIGMQLLAQKNPNSILVKTGVLDATPPNPEDFKIAQRQATKPRSATGGTAAGPGAKRPGAAPITAGVATFEGKKVAAWIAPILEYGRRHGWKGTVNSGLRTFADQTRIYNSGVRPAAKPGTSNHEGAQFPRGAVDVSDAQTLSRILSRSPYAKRLRYAGAKDPVHFSHPHNGSY